MEEQRVFHTYSCRFEFTEDYTRFILAADKAGVSIYTSELYHLRPEGKEHPFPDAYVEFKSQSELAELQQILRNGPDLHVPLQTLRPVTLRKNSLERDHSIDIEDSKPKLH